MSRLELPECCPKCGSKSRRKVPGTKTITRAIAGTINGVDYNAVRWTRKRCECGQIQITKTYLP